MSETAMCRDCKGSGVWAGTALRGVCGQMITECRTCNGTGYEPSTAVPEAPAEPVIAEDRPLWVIHASLREEWRHSGSVLGFEFWLFERLSRAKETIAELVKAARNANQSFQHATPKWNKGTQKAIDELQAAIARATGKG